MKNKSKKAISLIILCISLFLAGCDIDITIKTKETTDNVANTTTSVSTAMTVNTETKNTEPVELTMDNVKEYLEFETNRAAVILYDNGVDTALYGNELIPCIPMVFRVVGTKCREGTYENVKVTYRIKEVYSTKRWYLLESNYNEDNDWYKEITVTLSEAGIYQDRYDFTSTRFKKMDYDELTSYLETCEEPRLWGTFVSVSGTFIPNS